MNYMIMEEKMINIHPGYKILFTGDSITDCGSSLSEDINFLGHGYPIFIASLLGISHPELELTFVNTGVSGNRVADLAERWQRDVLNHIPQILSILIGINDAAQRYNGSLSISAMEFSDIYRGLLRQTRRELPDTQIVLMEPFLLPLRTELVRWRDELDPKIRAVRELAAEFSCTLIPLDGIFAAAACRREMSFWTKDGVHPTATGHALIEQLDQSVFALLILKGSGACSISIPTAVRPTARIHRRSWCAPLIWPDCPRLH